MIVLVDWLGNLITKLTDISIFIRHLTVRERQNQNICPTIGLKQDSLRGLEIEYSRELGLKVALTNWFSKDGFGRARGW